MKNDYVDLTAIQPKILKEFVEKYRQLEYEKDLIKEQMNGLKHEYKEKHFGKEGLKTIVKALQLQKGQVDVEMILSICKQLEKTF